MNSNNQIVYRFNRFTELLTGFVKGIYKAK